MEDSDTSSESAKQEQTKGKSGRPGGPTARPLMSFERPVEGDEAQLLVPRYLCRGGALLVCGPSGIGKSSLAALQLPVLWSLGRGDFGLVPNKPLRSLVIQAENDDGDIAEFRDGVCLGYNLSPSEMAQASNSVLIHYETIHRGASFVEMVMKPLIAKHGPIDIVVIDHALAYFDGDPRSSKDVGNFVRVKIDPVLDEFQCGMVMLHHTPKPPKESGRSSWVGSDYAYSGLGSIE